MDNLIRSEIERANENRKYELVTNFEKNGEQKCSNVLWSLQKAQLSTEKAMDFLIREIYTRLCRLKWKRLEKNS